MGQVGRIRWATACSAVGVVVAVLATSAANAANLQDGGGGELAYVINSNDYGKAGTVTFGLAGPTGAALRTLSRGPEAFVDFPAFSANGREIAYVGDNGVSGGPKVKNLSTGTVRNLYSESNENLILTGIGFAGDTVFYGENLSSSGNATQMPGLWSVPASGGTPRLITADDGVWYPTAVPGGRVLYVVMGNSSDVGGSSVWEIDANGADNHKLFSAPFQINLPSVSPNGQLIAFDRVYNDTTANIEETRIDGSHLTALTPEVSGHNDADPSWSPDGRELAFISARTGRTDGSADDQLFDAYEMTSSGADVHRVITTNGHAGLDFIAWGP